LQPVNITVIVDNCSIGEVKTDKFFKVDLLTGLNTNFISEFFKFGTRGATSEMMQTPVKYISLSLPARALPAW
jgi:hypothetical protein